MKQPSVNDAVAYIRQLATDYVKSLPPSAAGPTANAAESAIKLIEQSLNHDQLPEFEDAN